MVSSTDKLETWRKKQRGRERRRIGYGGGKREEWGGERKKVEKFNNGIMVILKS